jgi:tetratricopeptide (TPR) repeat protein
MAPRPLLLLFGLLALGAGLAAQSPAPAADRSGPELFAAGRFAEAEAAFSRALRTGGSDPSLYFNRALSRLNLGEPTGARSDLDAFLALVPESTEGLLLRAEVRLLLDDAAGAAADATAGLALRSDNPAALEIRARAGLRLGRGDAARSDLERLIALHPEHVGAFLARAELHEVRGDPAAAAADLRRAAGLAPDRPEPLHRLGLLLFRQLDSAAAVGVLREAAARAPTDATVGRALASALYAAGDFAAAAAELQRAVELAPDRSDYARLLLPFALRRAAPTPTSAPPPMTGRLPEDPWPRMLARFLTGEVSEEELLLGAQNLAPASARPGRLCEANFYLGTQLLLTGDAASARHYLQQAADSGLTGFVEHTLARAELARLPAAPTPERTKPTRRR